MINRVFWVVQSLVRADANSGAPGGLHLPSNLLGWNTGAPGGLHLSQQSAGVVGHPRSNLLERHR